jgi:RimJ/RimL family protein N-acetyltransferase
MIDYMFNECEIDEIITGAAIINPASWKIMEKLGFERLPETRMIDYTFMDEPVEDYQYHLTKEMYFRNR